jgi:predicted nucleotide-binding protein
MKTIISKLTEIKGKLEIPKESYSSFDTNLLNSLLERTKALVKRNFGTESEYLERLSQFNKESYFTIREVELEQLKNVIDIIIDDIELGEKKEDIVTNPIKKQNEVLNIASQIRTLNNKIFIVHGHNESMKQSVARVIEKLELDPIILHEQSNQGNTVIEKFMTHSNVGFAIVLLSADDVGYSIKDGEKKAKKRARQNVILELGFFIGKLGRNRVIALVENMNDFELPSDINGVVYVPYDSNESWKFGIARELMANGYNLDANRII